MRVVATNLVEKGMIVEEGLMGDVRMVVGFGLIGNGGMRVGLMGGVEIRVEASTNGVKEMGVVEGWVVSSTNFVVSMTPLFQAGLSGSTSRVNFDI